MSEIQNQQSRDAALSGIRVLELGEMVCVPSCCKLLADFGAEAIKVETPGTGDEARKRGPFPGDIPHPERSGLFLYLNTNKRGVTLDPFQAAGARIFQELAQQTDILVTDKSPKSLRAAGLDFASLKRVNPRLIMVHVRPFGVRGPYSNHKTYPLNVYHGGGEGYLQPAGSPWAIDLTRPPTKCPGFVGEMDAGTMAAIATLAAYLGRGDGAGQYVEVSQQEALLALNIVEVIKFQNEGFIESRETRAYSMGGVIPCKDGYVDILPLEQHMWESLVQVMGDPEWAKDPRFADRKSRAENGEEINAQLMAWAINHPKEEIYRACQEKGIPAGVVRTVKDFVDSEQVQYRNFMVDIEHPQAGKFQYPSAPFKFSESPWRLLRPAPLLGEHNEAVFCRQLGYSQEELVRLRGLGII